MAVPLGIESKTCGKRYGGQPNAVRVERPSLTPALSLPEVGRARETNQWVPFLPLHVAAR